MSIMKDDFEKIVTRAGLKFLDLSHGRQKGSRDQLVFLQTNHLFLD